VCRSHRARCPAELKLASGVDGTQPDGSVSPAGSAKRQSGLILYSLRHLADFAYVKVQTVANNRRYDFFLIVGWLDTLFLTSLTFAFAYLAIQKIDPSSFKSSEGANFWASLEFSLSKRAEITWSIRPWKNPVVPLAVELRLLHVQPFHNLVWDFYSCWIDLRIKASLDSQSGFGCGIPNQVHDDLVTF
jgi:hypothetical protein